MDLQNKLQLPIVAFEAFRRDFPDLNYWESLFYYREQCAIKFIFGSKAKIKFIK